MGEIASTAEMAEADWPEGTEPRDVDTDMVATTRPEGRGIEFHVSMRDYTQRDMEDLIVEAAARTIVGRHNDRDLAKKIEAKCIELVDAKASASLERVASDIIDQPLTPDFADKKPVTMREFIGLYGREYLTATVNLEGKPSTGGGWGNDHIMPRIEYLVRGCLDRAFRDAIQQATHAAVREARQAITAQHTALLKAEVERFQAAVAEALKANPVR